MTQTIEMLRHRGIIVQLVGNQLCFSPPTRKARAIVLEHGRAVLAELRALRLAPATTGPAPASDRPSISSTAASLPSSSSQPASAVLLGIECEAVSHGLTPTPAPCWSCGATGPVRVLSRGLDGVLLATCGRCWEELRAPAKVSIASQRPRRSPHQPRRGGGDGRRDPGLDHDALGGTP
jgi:hypothetical protein